MEDDELRFNVEDEDRSVMCVAFFDKNKRGEKATAEIKYIAKAEDNNIVGYDKHTSAGTLKVLGYVWVPDKIIETRIIYSALGYLNYKCNIGHKSHWALSVVEQ